MSPPDPEERHAALIGRLRALEPGAADVAPGSIRVVRAPGRVNLIGEHTDYNLGLVMPAAIGLETWVASTPRDDGMVRLTSVEAGETEQFDLASPGRPRGGWIDYVAGVAVELARAGVPVRGFSGVVESTIPAGAGLSSSAALELAAAWSLCADVPPPLTPMALAQAAQRAENDYVGVLCGLMDQFAAVHGTAGAAVLFDCRSLEHETIALPHGYTLVALDTRSPHRLGASQYNARREQCERGVALLAQRHPHVRSLRDVDTEMLEASADLLPEETLRRCRHVVAENARVLAVRDALRAGELGEVGRLFAASHASLRDLYEVSSPELDALVDIAASVPGVVAARMTGAGFGGCTVNIVRDTALAELHASVTADYRQRVGVEPGFYVVAPVDGAGVVSAPPD